MQESEKRDYLTGLYNRKGIIEQYESLPKGEHVHVMFCDLDNFKSVNDIYGHAAGDDVLVEVAKVLANCTPDGVAGRMSGDEFVVFFVGKKTRDELAEIADSMNDRIRKDQDVLPYLAQISISVGIVWNENTDTEFDQILYKSDVSMYQAKHQGKSCHVFYDDLKEQVQLEKKMENQVNEAFAEGCFKTRFLPVNNLQSSELEKAEVHILWEREEGGYWTQEQFRPVLEKSGFIRKLEVGMLHDLCREIQKIRERGEDYGRFSILLSSLTFIENGFLERIVGFLDECGIAIGDLELGISENAFEGRQSDQVIDVMQKLKESGFSLALYGFGMNFSSFRHWWKLPVDSIHFDENFIRENIKTNRGRQIIKTLIRLGRDLKMMMVADGISDKEGIVFLMGCGCDAASGSYFSEALDEAAYLEYAKSRIWHDERQIAFPFNFTLFSKDGEYEGRINGGGISYTYGISKLWGGIHFSGGRIGENVIRFPGEIFSSSSYTVSIWVRPDAQWEWSSVVFVQFLDGFLSVVPYSSEGISIFRICETGDLNGWHDVLCHCPEIGKWTMLTATYDAMSETTRYYFNGKAAGYQLNVPVMYTPSSVLLGGDSFQKSFRGTVSAFMVYNVAKTEEEVQELYDSFATEPDFVG